MVKKSLFFFALINILSPIYAMSTPVITMQQQMKSLAHINKTATKVREDELPAPYDYLLTQPLMTKGIEQYYQGTASVQIIYAMKNVQDNTYHRAIKMFVTGSENKEEIVTELAFITMNFNALPEKIITDVLHTNVPFGTLLSTNHIKIVTKDRSYFSVKCDEAFASLTHCVLGTTLYGRTNTLLRSEDNVWLAQVVEILPGFLR